MEKRPIFNFLVFHQSPSQINDRPRKEKHYNLFSFEITHKTGLKGVGVGDLAGKVFVHKNTKGILEQQKLYFIFTQFCLRPVLSIFNRHSTAV